MHEENQPKKFPSIIILKNGLAVVHGKFDFDRSWHYCKEHRVYMECLSLMWEVVTA